MGCEVGCGVGCTVGCGVGCVRWGARWVGGLRGGGARWGARWGCEVGAQGGVVPQPQGGTPSGGRDSEPLLCPLPRLPAAYAGTVVWCAGWGGVERVGQVMLGGWVGGLEGQALLQG